MELELTRVDYTVVGITSKNCLVLLPTISPKEPQRVAVSDSEGILQVFSIKKEEIQLHFKTLPGIAISSLKTAGVPGSIHDKIFISSGNEVRGFTKKGKMFLSFDSGMTENINSMFVLGNELFLCGTHIYNHYRDCKDVGSYLCGDVIVDVIAFYTQNTKRLTSLIACEGRMIRVLEHARVTFSMEVEGSPTVLHIFEDDNAKMILFGTIDGQIGVLDVENLKGFQRWLVTNERNSSGISCIASYDLTSSGTKNLIIGRNDGNVEVHYVNVHDEMDASTLMFVENCNESVTALQCGVVGNLGYDEILVATYSGRIFGLTTQVTDANFDGTTGSYIFSADTSHKIDKLKTDIEELQGKILKEREKYQNSTQSIYDELSAIPLLPVNFSFTLSKDTSTYVLILEAPTAIDNILLQCNAKVELLDVEKNSAVVSYSESESPETSNFLLATYRCQINTNRIELKIRTTEGQKGTLQVYISPLVQPKCSRLLQFELKALSLHTRVHNLEIDRALNELAIKGPFSLAEINSWLKQCLQEIPEKPQISEKIILYYQSCLLDSILRCTYQKGEVEFKSDNVSTISILKEFLTIEATRKKIKIDIKVSIIDDTIDYLIKIIEPKVLSHQKLVKDVALLDALNELETNDEENCKYLSEKYKTIMKNEKQIRQKVNANPGYLERLYGAVMELYIDYYKFRGINGKIKASKIPELMSSDYSYDNLMNLFRPNQN